jgi:hypothetical protein
MSDEDADFEQASPDEIAALEAFEARFPPGAFMAVAEVVDCLPSPKSRQGSIVSFWSNSAPFSRVAAAQSSRARVG